MSGVPMITIRAVAAIAAALLVSCTRGSAGVWPQIPQSAEEELAEKAIRYLETQFPLTRPGMTAIGLNGMRWVPPGGSTSSAMSLQSQQRVASAVNLPLRSETDPCALPQGANNFKVHIDSVRASQAMVWAENYQRGLGGWGSAVHELRFEKGPQGWRIAGVARVWHFDGGC
jgi:hypothetical protein